MKKNEKEEGTPPFSFLFLFRLKEKEGMQMVGK